MRRTTYYSIPIGIMGKLYFLDKWYDFYVDSDNETVIEIDSEDVDNFYKKFKLNKNIYDIEFKTDNHFGLLKKTIPISIVQNRVTFKSDSIIFQEPTIYDKISLI